MTDNANINMLDAWQFITTLYGDDEVKAACLRLQDEYGVDVSLFLFLIWLGHKGRVIPSVEIMAEIDGVVALWRENVVKVLRNLRRSLKSMGDEAATRISKMILNSEIEAEREALGPLIRAAKMLSLNGREGADVLVRQNVDVYFKTRKIALTAMPLVEIVLAKRPA